MALAETTTFLLRLFVYGLVGLAPSGNEAVVLVLEDSDHSPFVGLAARCVDDMDKPYKCDEIDAFEPETEFPGFRLKGYKIEISGISDGSSGSSPIKHYPPNVDEKPNKDNVASLSWVPSMASVLGKEKAGVDPKCLTDPEKCPHRLAGWMRIAAGEFRTCQFVRRYDEQKWIYSYQFKDKEKTKDHVYWGQYLADIIRLDVELPEKQVVSLKLSKFNGDLVGLVRLRPIDCPDIPGERCVDVMVGNIGKMSKGNLHTSGPHFKHFYQLLKVPIKPEDPAPIPWKRDGEKVDASVQPYCRRALPLVPLAKAQEKGRRESEVGGLDMLIASPDTRPICPMVIYSQ